MSNPSTYALRGRATNETSEGADRPGENSDDQTSSSEPTHAQATDNHDASPSESVEQDSDDELPASATLTEAQDTSHHNRSDPQESPAPAPAPTAPILRIEDILAQLVASNQALAQIQSDKIRQDLLLEERRLALAKTVAANKKAEEASKDGKQTAAEPTKFDGTSPRKLADFLTSNELRFLSAPWSYPTENSKVVAVASFLDGTPFKWFRNQMNKIRRGDDPPLWYSNYALFVLVLEEKFGPKDLSAQAVRDIRTISFGKGVADFNICFDEVADRLSWNDDALLDEYKRHLPSHLKTAINAREARPKTLESYQNLALDVEDRLAEDANNRQSATSNLNKRGLTPAFGTVRTETAKVTTTSSGPTLSPHPNARKTDLLRKAAPSDLDNNGRLKAHILKGRRDRGECDYCGEHKKELPCPAKAARARGETTRACILEEDETSKN